MKGQVNAKKMIDILNQLAFISSTSATGLKWFIALLALLVSLLTLYNAVKLKSGILAVATYAFGGGMLCLSAALLLLAFPLLSASEFGEIVQDMLFVGGFLLLGFGSYKIYQMSHV